MSRGKRWGAVAGAVGMLALAVAPAAVAEQTSATMSFQGKATNGYRYELEASKVAGDYRSVSIELTRGETSALYISRDPRRVDRRALVAKFGELGRVSLRLRNGRRFQAKSRCRDTTYHYGRFNGAIRFDGESAYARVRAERPFGFLERTTVRCRGGDRFPRSHMSGGSVVATCTDPSTGVFAMEFGERSPTLFLASRFDRSPGLFIFRSLFLEGAARNLHVSEDRQVAKLRPPEPFYGRGTVADERMTGQIKVALPGAGLVRLAPAEARIGTFRRFRPPRCVPYALARRAGNDSLERLARAIR